MNVTIVLKVFISDENTLFFLVSVGKNGEKLRFPIYYLRITREIASLRDAEVWRWEGFRRRWVDMHVMKIGLSGTYGRARWTHE